MARLPVFDDDLAEGNPSVMLKNENPEEGRYDSATTEKIIRIASRLDSENRETLSVPEIEQIAKEVGIEAAYVREALKKVAEEKVNRKLGRRDRPEAATTAGGHSKAEFWSTVAAFLIPLAWASIAFFVSGGDVTTAKFFTMMAPLPLALLIGFIAGNRKVGFFASLVLVLALWPALDKVLATEQTMVLKNTSRPLVDMSNGGISINLPPDLMDKMKSGEFRALGEEMGALQTQITQLEKALANKDLPAAEKAKLAAELATAQKRSDEIKAQFKEMGKDFAELEKLGEAFDEGFPIGPTAPPTPPGTTVVRSTSSSKDDALAPLLIFGSIFAGILGVVGAGVRIRHFPFPGTAPKTVPVPEDRGQMLDQYFELQSKLHGQKRRLAFLSVDVSDSTGMKHHQEELLVEHSFSRYTRWVAEVAARFGGEIQAAAGDGVMCAFPDEASALRAAVALQQGIGEFNSTHNRLPRPFRIRCGVSAGEVPWEPGTPIGLLQSPVIDRAAAMQKVAAPESIVVSQEVEEIAKVELGQLTPIPDPIAGVSASSWLAR
ncbi:MAG: adenylate/guanylate cyclase domain-containing protein [Fimbriimonadaceae bacterium]|nr:adenylate/guanylate cyclase domain-containing protein [Fimbriimonadaceae bacterium]